MFYLSIDQLDYTSTHYFAKSDTTKCNVDKFFFNPLIKSLTKKLSYHNTNRWIEKLSAILLEIPKNKLSEHKFKIKIGVDQLAE